MSGCKSGVLTNRTSLRASDSGKNKLSKWNKKKRCLHLITRGDFQMTKYLVSKMTSLCTSDGGLTCMQHSCPPIKTRKMTTSTKLDTLFLKPRSVPAYRPYTCMPKTRRTLRFATVPLPSTMHNHIYFLPHGGMCVSQNRYIHSIHPAS